MAESRASELQPKLDDESSTSADPAEVGPQSRETQQLEPAVCQQLNTSPSSTQQGPLLDGLTEHSLPEAAAASQPTESGLQLSVPEHQWPQPSESSELEQAQQKSSPEAVQPRLQLGGLPLLLTPNQTAPFQSLAADVTDDSAMLTGYEPPKSASSPAHKSSAMYFSTDSAGVLLQPKNPASQGGEEMDEMKLISDFHEALSKACKAGKAMQAGYEKRGACSNGECHEEESSNFNKQYTELLKYEQHLKGAYEKECGQLKERLQGMEEKQKEASRDHELEIVAMVKKHCEEKRQLKDGMAECLEFQNLKQKQSEVAQLKKWKKKYHKECEEASILCTKLAEKEKKLHSMRCEIEGLETTLRRHLLNASKDHIKQQLQTCSQIEKMVERLPNMSSSREMDRMVAGISEQVEKMRSLSTNRRSISWRR